MDRLRASEEEELGGGENIFIVFGALTLREEDFAYRTDSKMKRSLKSDGIGVCVFPSIHAKAQEETEEPPSKRDKRMVSIRHSHVLIQFHYCM